MSRIDLTVNKIFTTKNRDIRSIRSIFKTLAGITSDNIYQPSVRRSFKYNKDSQMEAETNLLTGARLEIIRGFEIKEVVNGNLCERCGEKSYLLTMTTLCEKCEQRMNIEFKADEAFKNLELHKLRKDKNTSRINDIDERNTYLFLFIESD